MPKSINIFRGSMLIIITTLCFTAMDAQVKYFSMFTTFIVFVWAKYFGQTIFFSFFFYKNRNKIFEYGNLKLQILRGICTICPTMGFFLALKYVPLAEATALGFLHPIMVVIASALILKERLTTGKIFIVILGFLGVLIITRPGLSVIHPASILIIVANLFFGIYQIVSKYLDGISNSASSLFFTTLIGLVISSMLLLLLPNNFSNLIDFGLINIFIFLFIFGLLTSLGEYCLITAYKTETASFLTPLFYIMLIWSTGYGFLIFKELPDTFSILGALILVAAGLMNNYINKEKV
tara:strand:- start:2468 stop:3349 length:882 start_codon:yes stop_codon:yes gene_type:complete